MALTLTVRSGSGSTPSMTLDQPKVLLGRSTSADLVLPDPSVSHQHASIRQRGSEYIVLDEGSTNGTHVGPVRLSEGTPRVLKSGDLLRLGRVWLEVRLEQAPPSPNQKDLTKEIALSLIEGGLLSEGEPAYPKLTVNSGLETPATLELTTFNIPYVLGRSKRCELPLDDEDCSRRHVELVRRGLGVWVRDLGSKNGAWLDETPLSDSPTQWPAGATLKLGKTSVTLSDPVTSTLWEIEAVEDEVVVGDVEPPVSRDQPDGPAPIDPSSRKRGDVAEVPRRRRSEPPPAKRHSVAMDLLILLLAVAVLALSAAGLWWLL